jgi:hypothetical protein
LSLTARLFKVPPHSEELCRVVHLYQNCDASLITLP